MEKLKTENNNLKNNKNSAEVARMGFSDTSHTNGSINDLPRSYNYTSTIGSRTKSIETLGKTQLNLFKVQPCTHYFL